MKKIDKLVSGSFVGPYLLSFFVAEFVLIMMFLWKYIDDILGKGFTMIDILELIFYYGVTIIPMAVPITILISSVMVFGDMSEKHELASLKSAGVSLIRIMRPAIYIALGTAFFSIFASNFLKPKANYLFLKRFTALRKQKPAMTIEEGIFNKDFKGFAIRVDSKGDDDQTINDVFIYDHTDNDKTKISLIKSKSGKMYTSEDDGFFVMNLVDGYQYRELASSQGKDKKSKYPFMRTKFDTWNKVFDMSEFDFDANSTNVNPNKEDMLTTPQLLAAIDSVALESKDVQMELMTDYGEILDIYDVQERKRLKAEETESNLSLEYGGVNPDFKARKDSTKRSPDKVKQEELKRKFANKRDRTSKVDLVNEKMVVLDVIETNTRPDTIRSLIDIIKSKNKSSIAKQASSNANSRKDQVNSYVAMLNQLNKKKNKYYLRLHQSYSWAMICIIFLFIGAPLGSIIRKGGYGYPLLVSILFYMIFMIMTIMGDKLNRSESINPIVAAWMPCIILAPISIWLTVKALKDSKFKGIGVLVGWVKSKIVKS